MLFIEMYVTINTVNVFRCYLMVFIYFEINCFKNISRFLTVFPLFFILLLSSFFMKLTHIFLGELQGISFGFQFYLTTFSPC